MAIALRDNEAVAILLKSSQANIIINKINGEKKTPLQKALEPILVSKQYWEKKGSTMPMVNVLNNLSTDARPFNADGHPQVPIAQLILIKLLIEKGASLTMDERTMLMALNIDVLGHEIKWASTKLPKLHQFAINNNFNQLKTYAALNNELNLPDCIGFTPLHYAIYYQRLEFCKELLVKEPKVNCLTYSGDTPLHLSIQPLKKQD